MTEDISEFGVCLENEAKNGGKPTKQFVFVSLICFNFLCLKMIFEATLCLFTSQEQRNKKKRKQNVSFKLSVVDFSFA